MTRVVRGIAWGLVTAGVLVLLYVVYLLFWTGRDTQQAQQELLEGWTLDVGDPAEATLPPDSGEAAPARPASPGEAWAVLWFERDGERIVHQDPLYVVEGVDVGDLMRGPGHYLGTAELGQPGNVAISGHRTTYGGPFYNLERLAPGDEIHVVDRDDREWVYRVQEQRVVLPTDVWAIGDDPLDQGRPMLTLTTCHPKWSAAQRLIVFATLTGA